jgi:peptidoglycan biosynthesis protein MviN/MurJ (putative lipid II flippase)
MTEQTRQYQAMAKTASWTMVSRVLGLVRDQLTAAVFGASAIGSASSLSRSRISSAGCSARGR